MRQYLLIGVASLALACNSNKSDQPGSVNTNLDSLKFTVEPADDWTNLMKRKNGWFGGDGIFALVRSGSEAMGAAEKEDALIWFSDTMLGEIIGD